MVGGWGGQWGHADESVNGWWVCGYVDGRVGEYTGHGWMGRREKRLMGGHKRQFFFSRSFQE